MSLYTDIEQSKISVSGSLDKNIRAEFNFSEELDLFKGHFPEKPILPGIAQIEMVKFSLETILKKKLIIRSIMKTKFLHFIEPATFVSVQITLLPLEGNDGFETLISARATLNTSNVPAGKINLIFSKADNPSFADG